MAGLLADCQSGHGSGGYRRANESAAGDEARRRFHFFSPPSRVELLEYFPVLNLATARLPVSACRTWLYKSPRPRKLDEPMMKLLLCLSIAVTTLSGSVSHGQKPLDPGELERQAAGDQPDDPGPLATGLSPKLKRAAI